MHKAFGNPFTKRPTPFQGSRVFEKLLHLECHVVMVRWVSNNNRVEGS